MLAMRPSNLTRLRGGLSTTARGLHTVRRYTDIAGKVAGLPGVSALPGAGIVSSAAKGIAVLDNIGQRFVS